MSRREDIDTSVWSDPDFLDLSVAGKTLYLWSFTNPRCGMAGIYKVARRAVAMETGIEGAELDAALDELADGRFAFFDGRVMWVRSRVKHLRTKSPSIATAIERDLERVGDSDLVDGFLAEYDASSWLWKHVTRPSREGRVTPSTPPEGPSATHSTPPRDPHQGSQGTGKGKGSGGSRHASVVPTPVAASDDQADEPTKIDEARDRLRDGAIDRVWQAYDETRRTVLGPKSVARLTPERRRLIGRRLKEHGEADVLDAVVGWRHSPHNRGENQQQQAYANIELLLRDAGHIERFRDLERRHQDQGAVGAGRGSSHAAFQALLAKQQPSPTPGGAA